MAIPKRDEPVEKLFLGHPISLLVTKNQQLTDSARQTGIFVTFSTGSDVMCQLAEHPNGLHKSRRNTVGYGKPHYRITGFAVGQNLATTLALAKTDLKALTAC